MTKKEIKAILAYYGYKVIKESWYKTADSILFNVYDGQGVTRLIYINTERRWASRQMLSTVQVMTARDISYMFFKEAEPCKTY
jgi:hypothetical protein